MREREEILQEMSDARADLARNLEQLRATISEKLDVRARAEELLDRARVRVRARPQVSVIVAFAAGVLLARN
ncbi:MAG: hypothetical protein AB7T06_33175 [Kofleriaceae bacterium]